MRPSFKEHYPLTDIAAYVQWRREDGQRSTPGCASTNGSARASRPPLPESLLITGTVEEWESWTKMAFPETGEYVFPEGLATVHIDREQNRGTYWEPNVWLVHPDLS